jgi:hypothetical protein
VKSLIKKVDAFIEAADEEHRLKIYDYLEPILRKEFDKVCRRNPRLRQVAWVNGSFLFRFDAPYHDRDNWWDCVEAAMGRGSPAYAAPKYARRFIELVCIANDTIGGLEPIERRVP